MKKLISAIQLIMLLFAFSLASAAVVPDDGHYEGTTSQGSNISFDVIGGELKNIDWMICGTCNGLCWGFIGWWADAYAPYFTWDSQVIQDESGYPIGIEPNASGMAVFGYCRFNNATSASGGIWHAMSYFTGNGFDVEYCFDNAINYEVARTGPVPAYSGPSEKTIRLIEK